jgi:hypothetical protein
MIECVDFLQAFFNKYKNTLRIKKFRERRLRVFENVVLRRVLGPGRDEIKLEWRKLHKEELNDLYVCFFRLCSPARVMSSSFHEVS